MLDYLPPVYYNSECHSSIRSYNSSKGDKQTFNLLMPSLASRGGCSGLAFVYIEQLISFLDELAGLIHWIRLEEPGGLASSDGTCTRVQAKQDDDSETNRYIHGLKTTLTHRSR
jgi:hypothetical protein